VEVDCNVGKRRVHSDNSWAYKHLLQILHSHIQHRDCSCCSHNRRDDNLAHNATWLLAPAPALEPDAVARNSWRRIYPTWPILFTLSVCYSLLKFTSLLSGKFRATRAITMAKLTAPSQVLFLRPYCVAFARWSMARISSYVCLLLIFLSFLFLFFLAIFNYLFYVASNLSPTLAFIPSFYPVSTQSPKL